MESITYIKDGISIVFNEEPGGGEDLFQYGEVLYEDKSKYYLGSVIIDSPYNLTPLGWFVWDENYIYKCLEGYDNSVIELIFDLNNRTLIESKEKREELYDKYLEKRNKTKKAH